MTPEELAAAIKAHPFAELAPELMYQALEIARDRTLPFTPVDTGLLRTGESSFVEAGGYRGFVGTDVTYSVFQKVEFFQLGAEASVQPVEALLQKIGVTWFDLIARGA